CNSDVLQLPVPGEDVDYDADLTPHIRPWTSLYAATEDVHDPARFEREVPVDKRLHTRGIEVGQIFYFGTKYSEPMKAVVTGPTGSNGRSMPAPTGSECRAWSPLSSRRSTTRPASNGRTPWRHSKSRSSISSRAAPTPTPPASGFTASSPARGWKCSTTILISARGRNSPPPT